MRSRRHTVLDGRWQSGPLNVPWRNGTDVFEGGFNCTIFLTIFWQPNFNGVPFNRSRRAASAEDSILY